MAWIRLSDDYNDHPKFDNLSDGAFRLWHQGMGFCRKYQTDGLMPLASVRKFKAYTARRMAELMTPWRLLANPLWRSVEGEAVKVHDYLDWNPSKDEADERRIESREAMRELRESRRKVKGIPPVSIPVSDNSELTAMNVRGGDGKVIQDLRKDTVPFPARCSSLASSDRAAALLKKYRDLYAIHRNGAKLRLLNNTLEYGDACTLVDLWDDARLEKLAVIVLTSDEDFIQKTDRSFRIFAMKASWADDKLTMWEQEQKRKASA